MTPNFSAYPWGRVPRMSRREAQTQSIVARWIGARECGDRLRRLVGARSISARVVPSSASGAAGESIDPYASFTSVRANGTAIEVAICSSGIRAIAQRLLGGPQELLAPRPLTISEQAIGSLVVATALEDLGVAGAAWPVLGESSPVRDPRGDCIAIDVDVALDDIVLATTLRFPRVLELRAPPSAAPSWASSHCLDVPVVLGRCAIHRDDLARLAIRSVITLERPTTDSERRFRPPTEQFADLEVFDGAIGLRSGAGDLVATVRTGYVRRDMTMPDEAHVELSVGLGTTQLTLRQVLDLAVGQIVTLGRPLAGPFEVRAQGRVLGRGELVDVDGELAVRIVSLGQ
jgi:flagellar motor switch/type III secretory pathway protein FliN